MSFDEATHVLIRGELFPFAAKAPFVTSGKSILGAAEYREVDGKQCGEFKCHECGAWCPDLGNHVRFSHRNFNKHRPLTMREYKIRHGLALSRCVVHPEKKRKIPANGKHLLGRRRSTYEISKCREAYAEILTARSGLGIGMTHSPETSNLRGLCCAQRRVQLVNLWRELGRTPTKEELRNFSDSHGRHPLDPTQLKKVFGKPLRSILLELNMLPRGKGKTLTLTEHFSGPCLVAPQAG